MSLTLLKLEDSLLIFESINQTIDKNLMKAEGIKEEDLIIAKYIVNENLEPLSNKQYSVVESTEEDFHKNLRRQAAEHKHLITSHSTDAEWNPEGYTKNLSDE